MVRIVSIGRLLPVRGTSRSDNALFVPRPTTIVSSIKPALSYEASKDRGQVWTTMLSGTEQERRNEAVLRWSIGLWV